MTNLKKLRVIKFLLFAFLFISCAQVDYKGIYTDKSTKSEFEKKLPLILVGQELLANPTTFKYLQIAKTKNPLLRSFLILKRELTPEELEKLIANLNYFNGLVLFSPIDMGFIKKHLHDIPIINASIYDMENDGRFRDEDTIAYAPIIEDNIRYIFLPVTEKMNIPSDRPELFKYYLEDPFLTILKVRKEERKRSDFDLILFTNVEGHERVKESAHEGLKYYFINDATDRRLFFENRFVDVCDWFYKATEDCFVEEGDAFIHKKRVEVLSVDDSKTSAVFLGEEIKL